MICTTEMNRLLIFFGCVILIISCSKCKDPECTDSTNPDCPNYVEVVEDPCAGLFEANANFIIEEKLTSFGDPIWVETDTILKNKVVQFRSTYVGADEYKWYIGSQVYTTPNVSLLFESQWSGNDIPITLVVKKIPNNDCYPNDDGYDSITKSFYVSYSLIYPTQLDVDSNVFHGGLSGTYRLANEIVQDSIDVVLSFCDNGWFTQLKIENIDGSGTACTCESSVYDRNVYQMTFREAHFGFANGDADAVGLSFCKSLQGVIRRPMNGEAEFEIESNMWPYDNGPITTTWYKYKGRKIN